MSDAGRPPRTATGEVIEGEEPRAWTRWPPTPRRPFPRAGALLVFVGLGLLARQFVPGLGLVTIFLLAVAGMFALDAAVTRARWPLLPAALLGALGLGRLAAEAGLVRGESITALLLGAVFLGWWALAGRSRPPDATRGAGGPFGRWPARSRGLMGSRPDWALWLGAIFVLIGLVQLTDEIPGLPDLGNLWPLVVVAVGVVLVAVGMRRERG